MPHGDIMDVSNLKPLENGFGAFGRCYILDDNTLYKQFYCTFLTFLSTRTICALSESWAPSLMNISL